jgi:hypothetical protein
MIGDYDPLLMSWDECRTKLIASEKEVFRLHKAARTLAEKWRKDADNTEEHHVSLTWAHGLRTSLRSCADALDGLHSK